MSEQFSYENEDNDVDAEFGRLLGGEITPLEDVFLDRDGVEALVGNEARIRLQTLDRCISLLVLGLRRAHYQTEQVLRSPVGEDMSEEQVDAIVSIREQHPADLCHTALMVACDEVAALMLETVRDVAGGQTGFDTEEVVRQTVEPLDSGEVAQYLLERLARMMDFGGDDDQ